MEHFGDRKREFDTALDGRANLTAVVDACPLAIMLLGPDGKVRLWNPACERMFGWTAEEVIGRFLPSIPEERLAEYQGYLRKVLQGETFSGVEAIRQRKGGAEFDVAIWAVPVVDANGETCCLSMLADISERKQAERLQGFLGKVSDVLASSLDYDATLQQVCRLTVPVLADFCQIYIDDGAGQLQRIALAHADPERDAIARALIRSYPLDLGSDSPTSWAVRTGQTVLLTCLDEDIYGGIASDPEHRRILASLGLGSAISLPMRAGGKTIGALVLARAEDSAAYVEADLAVAAELARRAGLAIENARLFESEQKARREAEQAADRVARLQSITAALVERLTPSQIAAVVVEQAIGALGAERGAVGLLVDGGAFFEVLQVGGYPDTDQVREELRHWKRFPLSRGGTWANVARTGKAEFLSSSEERLAQHPEVSQTQAILGLNASATLPLAAGGRTVGVLWLNFPRRHDFDEKDREFLLALARHCSQAIERASLDLAEQRSRRRAELAAERVGRLQAVTARLAAAATQHEVAAAVASEAVAALGARAAAVVVVGDDQKSYETIFQTGYSFESPDQRAVGERWYHVSSEAPTPTSDAIQTGELVILTSGAERAARYPHLAEVTSVVGGGASVTVPLLLNGHPVGALHLAFPDARAFSDEERALLLTLGRLCAQAFERARLLTVEQAARHESENARQRATILAETSRLLGEISLDEQEILETICRRVAEAIGDGCMISVPSPDGVSFAAVVIYHPDPVARDLAYQLTRQPSTGSSSMAARIIAKGEPIIVPEVTPEQLAEIVGPHRMAYSERIGFHSLAVIPLRARHQTIGAMSVWRDRPGKPYTDPDVRLLQDLASRAAVALENSRLFAQTKEAVNLRNEFLSVAAHELKTPMTALRGSVQLLLRLQEKRGSIDEDRLRERLTVINDQSVKISRLVDRLLDVSRIEAGRLIVDRAPTDLVALIRDVAAAAQARSDRHQISVQSDEPVVASVDALRLEQVVTNLVDNALKYSPNGGLIELAVTHPAGEQVLITVTDHGIGIPPDHRAQIFDRFFQAHPSQYFGGMGLGLYISRQIVDLHGGSLEAEFPESGGTRFVLRLPASG